MSIWETDRELLHFSYGFFLTEGLWFFFFFLRRMSEKKKLPWWIDWLGSALKGYFGLYAKSMLTIGIAANLHELWDLTWKNNHPAKSWIDVGFWLLGCAVAIFAAYRKRFHIMRWTD